MDQDLEQNFMVQSVRIDKHEFEPKKCVVLSSHGIRINASDTQSPNDNIVLDIPEKNVLQISCYLCDEHCVLLLTVAKQCITRIQDTLQLDEPLTSFDDDNQIILQLNSDFDVALKALQSVFSSKIIDLDDSEYIDAMDRFFERSDPEILVYPPPQTAPRGIRINRKDYKCLSYRKGINDVMVDFYLKYLHDEKLTDDQREQSYTFSQFFYTRLAGSQHDQVARWTKNVNLFAKDFIVIPINIQMQWLLAIICFPNHSTEKRETEKSCILFFDSLATDSWDEVAATLRNYLTCEYRTKFGIDREFNRQNMPEYEVDVPQQDNVYDSGLYLLQYAESFFKSPITDYRSLNILNQQLSNWFDKTDVRMKREHLSILITQLVREFYPNKLPLPNIRLPAITDENFQQLYTDELVTIDLCEDGESEEDEGEGDEDAEDESDEDESEDDEEIDETQPIDIICLDDECDSENSDEMDVDDDS